MSESLDGVSCSDTRQNAGSVLNAAIAFGLVALGGANAPAGTDSADSTRPFVTLVCASDSHAMGAGVAACNGSGVAAPSRAIRAAILMRRSLDAKRRSAPHLFVQPGRQPGTENVLSRLSELMLVEAIRRYLVELPSTRLSWLAGLRDPIVGRALEAIHSAPRDPWTIESLGRAIGVSRSVPHRLKAAISVEYAVADG